jgi:hypothetical protein
LQFHRLLGVGILLASLAGISCSRGKAPDSRDAEFEIKKTYERGPVQVELKVSKGEITIADRITLVLEATAEEAYEVEMPKFGEKLDEFGIIDYHTAPPALGSDGRLVTRKSYVLEPFLSGEYTIPPMAIGFRKKGEEKKEDARHEVETEKLTIHVKSILPEKEAELQIKEIAGPVELPRPQRGWLLPAVAGAAGLGGLAGLLAWRWRRRRRVAAIPTVPAHELAYDRLEKLVGLDLIAKGEIKAFYRGISDVLRHYIEDRFGLHAPERTTEEFLDELRSNNTLEAQFQPLLREFLGHCDLVKFAELRPTNTEIQKTFDACKAFIEATRADAAPAAMGTAAA